jgi:hypothetical protein
MAALDAAFLAASFHDLNEEAHIHFASPHVWKKTMKLGSDKMQSLKRAAKLWPSASVDWRIKANDGIAEAALMAYAFARNERIA